MGRAKPSLGVKALCLPRDSDGREPSEDARHDHFRSVHLPRYRSKYLGRIPGEKDFSGITTQVEEIVRTQKFEGASADLLNANIIARDLGLADKHEGTTTLRVSLNDMTDEELAAIATGSSSGTPSKA